MFRPWALSGPSIQVDPLFSHYLNRSAVSIAEEIERAGYRTVHYFVVNESKVNGELVEAFHKRGIAVWALVIGNGTFTTAHLPKEWPQWRMGLVRELHDGFERLSLFSQPYLNWKKRAVAELVSSYPFDGIEIAEPYFPEWDGIRRGVYGDVGLLAQQAFREQYGLEMPDFVNKSAANYYLNNPKVYEKWISFRVDAVNRCIDEIMNGVGGCREVRPDIYVATWSLAINGGHDAEAKLREWQGLDAPAMIARVRPNIHFLQTHWPDWMQKNLSPDYIKGYERFASPIRRAYPKLPLGVQTDIGSLPSMVRDRRWLDQFQMSAFELNYDAWTAYEYHLGGN
ncbi:N-acyl-D-glucosamine 2-epimerase [Paenibacillus sediminis]|uniref:N-acyl-D-glucosamine 2-epimerase n=1 Tax=Paenibacillus sediminis TaxID=664909 RepID=A0ABS4H4A1_9BACL|nr:N-acyl-D-glucosamine 2-epimerase [Paenibacillus sediminis]MBP1937336.1 hypothetical protein [Paenibacillus sediminis]